MINTDGKYYMATGWGRGAGDAEPQLGGGTGSDALHHLKGADPPSRWQLHEMRQPTVAPSFYFLKFS